MASILINDRYSFQINGIGFKAKSMKISWESLAAEDSGRTLDGVMHIYWVKRRIRKLEIVMPPCTYETLQMILTLVQGQEYNISFFDPMINRVRTIKCYTSNASTDIYSGIVHNGLYQGFEFHAIELSGE